MKTFSVAESSTVAPRPFNAGTTKANSTGTTTSTPANGPCPNSPQRPRSQSFNRGEGQRIFKVYKYVDQSLLDDNAEEIQLLRAENIQLMQTLQLREQRMRMLELSNEKHRQANSLALNILKSHDLPRDCLLDACEVLEEALRLSD